MAATISSVDLLVIKGDAMPAIHSRRRRRGGLSAGLVVIALGLGVTAPPARAQNQPAGQGQGQGQGRGQGQGQPGGRRAQGGGDPAQFRQRMDERMKQALGATDEEWALLQPRIEKVRTGQRQVGAGRGMGALFGRGGRTPGQNGATRGNAAGLNGGANANGGANGNAGGRGGRGQGGAADDSPVALKARELRQSVDSGAGPDEVKGKLAALRDARAKAREQLAAAQAELKEIVTSKQEATLMVMGLLE